MAKMNFDYNMPHAQDQFQALAILSQLFLQATDEEVLPGCDYNRELFMTVLGQIPPGHIPPDIYPLDNNTPCQIPPGHIPTIQKIYDMFDI